MKRLKPILIIILVLVLVFSLGSVFKKLITKVMDDIYEAIGESTSPYEQEAQIPLFTHDHDGFTVIEWGGSEIS